MSATQQKFSPNDIVSLNGQQGEVKSIGGPDGPGIHVELDHAVGTTYECRADELVLLEAAAG